MCGILGAVTPQPIADQAVEAALAAIRHRGPDDQGIHRDHGVVLGMRRLSIIDREGGHQPIYNEDGAVAVVLNGEIYNYVELMLELERRGHTFRTRSDTEVLVHLYEEEGLSMCARLRGMFAFAIHDARRRRVFVARDRFGKKPLYYATTPAGGLLFASELKAMRPLCAAIGLPLRIRDGGIYDFLSLGVVPQPDTLFERVRALPPGSALCHEEGRCREEGYWSLGAGSPRREPYRESLRQARARIADAVAIRLRSDVPLGVFLSGGLDSSIVAYEASRALGGDLDTFTVKMDDPVFDESAMAARTARHLGVRNTILDLKIDPVEGVHNVVRQYDQPYADSSAIPSMEIARLARRHVTVVLTGDGGDETFGGYRRYVAAREAQRFAWVPGWMARGAAALLARADGRRRSARGFLARFARGLGQTPAERYLAWTTDMLVERDKAASFRRGPVAPTEDRIAREISALGPASALRIQMATDVRVNLLSDLLVKMDMATMAHSLEARSPFLDHLLAEWARDLPDEYKVRGRVTKRLLRDAYRSVLPAEVTGGIKRGFEVPLAGWLAGPLRGLMGDLLGARSARVRGYLDDRLVDEILAGRAVQDKNWPYIQYSLLVLELWLAEYAPAG
jgi:asparagine synthase (glutamine-hydrolysing)